MSGPDSPMRCGQGGAGLDDDGGTDRASCDRPEPAKDLRLFAEPSAALGRLKGDRFIFPLCPRDRCGAWSAPALVAQYVA